MSNVEQGVQQELAKLLDDFIAGLQQLRQRLAPSPPSPSAAEQKRYRILPEQAAKPPDSACPFHINPGAVQQVPYRVSFSRGGREAFHRPRLLRRFRAA